MTSPRPRPDPLSVVEQALGRSFGSLSKESAMYRDHGWDSFGHVSVIVALETAYDIRIPDNEIMVLTSMRAISEFAGCLRKNEEA